MQKFGIKAKGLVSDRASALIKLGESAYLNVVSMPDLFHFNQDIGKAMGLQIGKKREQARKALESAKESCREKLQEAFEGVDKIRQSYRKQTEQINKTVHPLNEQDEWTDEAAVEKGLLHCFTAISKLAAKLNIDVAIKKAEKVLAQISPIAKGVQAWIDWTKSELEQWVAEQLIVEKERQWIVRCAFPYLYWKIQLTRTQAKFRNRDLRTYYKERMETARHRGEAEDLTKDIAPKRQEELFMMAYQLAISFQRASSQVEGRNGYLSFVNHAHKGIPKQRLKVLTVIHNYDIKRMDGTSPAQRLFKKDFPDLFEFLSENVTGFKEPRKRQCKSLKISFVQR